MIGDKPNWRDDDGLVHRLSFKKRFALRPVICSGGEKIWLKNYYSVYRVWSSGLYEEPGSYAHSDYLEDITEADYIVRKLADNL